MLDIALNHVTVANASTRGLFDMADQLGCVGVELRNDLGRALFEDDSASSIATLARDKGQRLLALAEVKAFNAAPDDKRDLAEALIVTAAACGAEAVVLIPALADRQISRADQRQALRHALAVLQPVLETYAMRELIEPLGFANSTLRFKEDVVAVLHAMGRPTCFGIVHDSFHHHLADETDVYPDLTKLVHISGVVDRAPSVDQMTDAHRVLVDAQDRLNTIDQLRALLAGGYAGPLSFEAFAPDIQNIPNPAKALAASIAFIRVQLADGMAKTLVMDKSPQTEVPVE